MTLQPTAAVPVDARTWWIVYLRGALFGRPESYASGVKFYSKVPADRPDRFVVVRRDGGSVSGVFDQPRVALDVWASKDSSSGDKDAADLASLLIALALRAPRLVNDVTRVEHLSGPNVVPDLSGQPRYLALIEATHRATVLTS